MTKQEIKVIEIEGIKLSKNAKYIFTLSPMYGADFGWIVEGLNNLIGPDKYVLLPVEKDDLRVFEVLSDETPEL